MKFKNQLENPSIENFPIDKENAVDILCMFLSQFDFVESTATIKYREDLNIVLALISICDDEDVYNITVAIEVDHKPTNRYGCTIKCVTRDTFTSEFSKELTSLDDFNNDFNDHFEEFKSFIKDM